MGCFVVSTGRTAGQGVFGVDASGGWGGFVKTRAGDYGLRGVDAVWYRVLRRADKSEGFKTLWSRHGVPHSWADERGPKVWVTERDGGSQGSRGTV